MIKQDFMKSVPELTVNVKTKRVKPKWMAVVDEDNCTGCQVCVPVCPVDCIHGPDDKKGAGAEAKADGFDPDGKQLYIDPEECIDCGACEPECPVEAIFEESEVPAEWEKYIKLNYDFFGREID